MKRFKIIILFPVFILLSQAAFPQSITVLEKQYEKLQDDLNSEQVKLDSLKNVFASRIKLIDKEKSKANPDKGLITGLMASSVTISDKIDSEQKNKGNLESKIESVKEKLSKEYSEKIDSLQAIVKEGNLSAKILKEIKSEIYSYIEKKILVTPKISLLSFRPEKIARINLSSIKDPEQREIYKEYLTNALTEVDNRLKNVDESVTEVGKIISLQKKTARFLEETEFETGLPQQITQQTKPDNYFGETNGNTRVIPNSPTDGFISAQKSNYIAQAQNYNLLLWQLKISFEPDLKRTVNPVAVPNNLTLFQYYDLLKELKNKLRDYKLLLSHKIGNPG